MPASVAINIAAPVYPAMTSVRRDLGKVVTVWQAADVPTHLPSVLLADLVARTAAHGGDRAWISPAAHDAMGEVRRWLDGAPRSSVSWHRNCLSMGWGRVWFIDPAKRQGQTVGRFDEAVIDRADEIHANPVWLKARRVTAMGAVPMEDHWFAGWEGRGTHYHVGLEEVLAGGDDPDMRMAAEDAAERLNRQAYARQWLGRRITEQEREPERLTVNEWGHRYMPEYLTRPDNKMHRWLCERLDRMDLQRGARVSAVGTRESGKSTWPTLIYIVKKICEGTEPYILILSETYNQARDLLGHVSTELAENERIAEDYPHVSGRGPIWSQRLCVTRNGIRIEAAGASTKLRGRRKRQFRPSLIVGDDIESITSAYSQVTRENRRNWWTREVMKAGNADTNVVALGNAVHRDCIVMRNLKTPGWKASRWPSILKWPERMDLWKRWEDILLSVDQDADECEAEARAFYKANKAAMERGCVLLWPEAETLYGLMMTRATEGHGAFESEKQCNPVDPELCEWPEEYLSGEDIWVNEWPAQFDDDRFWVVKSMGCDPSKGKDAKRSDYSAIIRLARSHDGVMYVEADLRRRDSQAVINDLISGPCGAMGFGPDGIGLETNQWQSLLSEEAVEAANRIGLPLPVYDLDNRAPKPLRIRRLTPYLHRRSFRFIRTPGTMLMVDQMRDFPQGDFDDGPDGLEMALRVAIRVYNGRVEESAAIKAFE